MQHPPPLLQEAVVSHFMRERVLQCIVALGEQACLIEKLRRLEVSETTMQRLVGQVRKSLQQGERYLSADHGGGLEQAFLFGWQAVNTRRQHRLDGGGDLNRRQGVCQAIAPTLAHQDARLYQRADALFQKERVALRTGNQEMLEWLQAGM